MTLGIIKVFVPALLTFLVGFAIVPRLTHWMFAGKMWKRTARNVDNDAAISKTFEDIKNFDTETHTPRVGGIIIWGSVAIATLLLFLASRLVPGPDSLAVQLDYVSRSQTLLPFMALIFGALYGLFEDIIEIYVDRFQKLLHGMDRRVTMSVVLGVAIIFAVWFFVKLDYTSIHVPFAGDVHVGWLFIPYFILVMLGTFSSRVIDGLDGLAGGVMAVIYMAFGTIAIIQSQFDIGAFCFVVAAGVAVFLWYNVQPARFYMGETGMMGLTLALPIVAFLLKQSLLILIVALPLAATAFSAAAQMVSKKYFGKKIFLVAPLHHHFQALGWSTEKVVMRYWLFTAMTSVVGVILAIIG